MTGLSAAHLNSAKVRRLLSAVGSAPRQDDAAAQAVVYDWRKARYFNEDQCNRLAAVASQVAAAIAGRLARFFNAEPAVAPASITQHFAGDLDELGAAQGRYTLAFGANKDGPCGCLSLSEGTAMKWVTHLLGDSQPSSDPNRPLSSLEESLLGDLVTAMLEPFLAALRPHQDLRPGERITRGVPILRFEPTQEICRIAFAITAKDTTEADDVLLLLPCSALAPIVGKGRQAPQSATPEELSRTIMEHVQQMPICVTARLACTVLDFEEFLDLGPDDILLLDKSMDEPVELLMDGRVVFRGRAVSSSGERAVFITESAARPTPPAPKSAPTK